MPLAYFDSRLLFCPLGRFILGNVGIRKDICALDSNLFCMRKDIAREPPLGMPPFPLAKIPRPSGTNNPETPWYKNRKSCF
jgi:hypothetical protein